MDKIAQIDRIIVDDKNRIPEAPDFFNPKDENNDEVIQKMIHLQDLISMHKIDDSNYNCQKIRRYAIQKLYHNDPEV